MATQRITTGYKNGKRWIAGQIPMKQNVIVNLDTRTGEGIATILQYLKDFIRYQAMHISLPSHSTEDIIQELNIIALSAISDYDISRGANMLTFLQNHIKNRIINIYKFATEKCRTATHENFRFCKVKCPRCKQYSVYDENSGVLTHCKHCGYIKKPNVKWRSYPIPIGFISANEEFALQDGSVTTIQDHCSYDDITIINGRKDLHNEDELVTRLALSRSFARLDSATKKILLLFVEGHTMIEISNVVKLSTPCIKSKLQALRKNKAFIEIFSKDG